MRVPNVGETHFWYVFYNLNYKYFFISEKISQERTGTVHVWMYLKSRALLSMICNWLDAVLFQLQIELHSMELHTDKY